MAIKRVRQLLKKLKAKSLSLSQENLATLQLILTIIIQLITLSQFIQKLKVKLKTPSFRLKLTTLAHLVGGIAINFFPAYIAVLITVLFIIYEIDEEWHIKDTAYRDIVSYLIGIYVGAIIRVSLIKL